MKNKKVVFAELSLLVITVIWGLGFPITRIAIDFGFGPSTIMLGRFMIAALLLTIVYFKRLKFIDKKIILFGIITGVFLFLGFYFQTVGNVYTTPSKNGFITQLNIVFVPFLFMLFFRKLVDVYNVIGEHITSLINEDLSAGEHSINFNANNLPSGIYFYKLQQGNYSDLKKMILLK